MSEKVDGSTHLNTSHVEWQYTTFHIFIRAMYKIKVIYSPKWESNPQPSHLQLDVLPQWSDMYTIYIR